MPVDSRVRHLLAMIQQPDPKNCLTCAKPLRGRADKKFCDDYCRNSYNNRRNADSNNYVRSINSILKKNRRILEELILPGEETGRTDKEKLLELGFKFRYSTHSFTTQSGKIYSFCYEYGWLAMENGLYLIVKKTQE